MPKSAKVSTVVCAGPKIAGMHPGLSHGNAWGDFVILSILDDGAWE